MQFLSRFSSKKQRQRSIPPPSTQSNPSYLPLAIPSASLLSDDSFPLSLSKTSGQNETRDGNSTIRSVDTTPWIEVVHGGGSPKTQSDEKLQGSEGTKAEDPKVVREETIKLEKSRIETEQMITLMDECGAVITSRGLTTLGLFRPFRLPESLPRIRQLCLLFLDYTTEYDLSLSSKSAVRGTRASKTVKLHRFTEELRYAGIHDVVAVLKWGLRHFCPSAPLAGSSAASPFDFYQTYLASTSTASHPHTSFSRFLLPLLPPTSQSLLVSTLKLVQAVSAYTELNAMTCRKLCRTIGYYLFPLEEEELGRGGWEKLYERWKESGEVLEGMVKAYLWEQSDLPPRLQELVVDYPRFVERSRTGSGDGGMGRRKVRVLRVEMESRGEGWKRVGEEDGRTNDQETGYLAGTSRFGGTGKFARRGPIEILVDAFEAELDAQDGKGGLSAWEKVKALGNEDEPQDVLDEEVTRVLGLLGLSSKLSALPPTLISEDRPTSPRRRVTSGPLSSLSEDSPTAGSPSITTFPNKSVSHLSSSRDQKRIVTPSWNDFAKTGFSVGDVSVSDEFGRFDPSTAQSSAPPTRLPKQERSRVVTVEVTASIEEEFVDFWIDTLNEFTTQSSPISPWPSFVIAPLRSSLSSSLSDESSPPERLHLLIHDQLLPLAEPPAASPPPSGLGRNPSRKGRSDGGETSSLNPRKWTKRASSIFGGGGGGNARGSFDMADPTPTSRTKKASRRSMFLPNLPPPIPIAPSAPRRPSTDVSVSPQPYSTSPPEGNMITRTISRTTQRRKSRSSISSPQSEEERQLASPPRFEAELMEPVPAIPPQYSMESEEAKRRSQASPAIDAPVPLPEEVLPRPQEVSSINDIVAQERPVKESAVPLVPSSPPISPPSPNVSSSEAIFHGQPVLGTVVDAPAESDSRNSGSESLAQNALVESRKDPEVLVTTPPSNAPLDSATTPSFTLSPPDNRPAVLAADVAKATTPVVSGEAALQTKDDDDRVKPIENHIEASGLGLGLSNIEQHTFDAPLPVETRESPAPPEDTVSSMTPSTLAAPTLPSSPSLDSPAAHQDSPTIPASPTPSAASQGSSNSKKFLSRTRSFLSRKKSSNVLEKEHGKAAKVERNREKELVRTPKDESRDLPKKERKAPTPVSSVKRRVAELEAANANGTGSLPSSPTTASRIRKGSSPAPASPTPLPSTAQPGSAASSIVPLPPVAHEDSDVRVDPKRVDPKEAEEEPNETSTPIPAAPEAPVPDDVLDTSLDSSETHESSASHETPSSEETPTTHERQGTTATIVPKGSEETPISNEIPHTPRKEEGVIEASAVATPTASSTPGLFGSQVSSLPSPGDDPFIDSTPVKNSSHAFSPPAAGAPPLVTSQSHRSISTQNSMDTFETAAAPSTVTSAAPSIVASAASSIHERAP